jgi:3-oxoacyl-ACP reductase-like protein
MANGTAPAADAAAAAATATATAGASETAGCRVPDVDMEVAEAVRGLRLRRLKRR